MFIAFLIIFTSFLGIAYFSVGWFVRKCARRMVPSGKKDAEGKEIMKPRPRFWYFQPAGTTAYIQREGNDVEAVGKGSKATPGSGSGILDVTHAMPGMILDRTDMDDMKKWRMVDCQPGQRETRRKGLFYYLYGVHSLGIWNELRTVKVREVKLSIDEDALERYTKELQEWEKGGKKGEKPREPTYEEHVRDYETLFPFYSREHDIAIRESETNGAYTLDLFTKVVYKEEFPVRARLEVSDPNATLSTFVEQSVNGETGSHEPEYYLFEKTVNEPTTISFKERRKRLLATAVADVADKTRDVIGLSVKEIILYAIDMDEDMRRLLELQERTEREEQARILESEREITVAANNAKRDVEIATGKRDAQKILNEGQADHVQTVILPLAREPRGAAIRFAEAYENNETLTSLALGGDLSKIMPDNVIVPVGR